MNDLDDIEIRNNVAGIGYSLLTNTVSDVLEENTSALKNTPYSQVNQLVENKIFEEINRKKRVYCELENELIIPELLTSDQQNKLTLNYGKYNIRFTNNIINSHSFAAASRRCEERHLQSKLNFSESHEYNGLYYSDIGGNFAANFKKDLKSVHHCSPILDVVDANRNTNRINQITNFARVSTLSTEQIKHFQNIKDINDGVCTSTDFLCRNKVQNCNVRTPYGLALQSLYDIAPIDLVTGMYNKGMTSVVASMMWDPKILLCRSGSIDNLNVQWRICKTENDQRTATSECTKPTIRFYFVKDSALAYEHDLSTYIAWFVSTVINGPCGSVFVIELLEEIMNIQYIRINRVDTRSVGINRPISVRRWTNLEDKVILRWYLSYLDNVNPGMARRLESYYSSFVKKNRMSLGTNFEFSTGTTYEQILQDAKRYSVGSKYVEISFLVDKDLVTSVLEFILGAADKKFSQPECFNYARSRCHAILVGKEVILNGKEMDPRLLFILSQVLYTYAWMFKYNHGIDMQNFMGLVNENRRLLMANWFKRLFFFSSESRLRRFFGCPFRVLNEKSYQFFKNKIADLKNMISVAPPYMEFSIDSSCSDESKVEIPSIGILRDDESLLRNILACLAVSTDSIKPDINTTEVKFNLPLKFREKFIPMDYIINCSKFFVERSHNSKLTKKLINEIGTFDSVLIEYQPSNFFDKFISELFSKFYVIDFSFLCEDGLVYLRLIGGKGLRKRMHYREFEAKKSVLLCNLYDEFIVSNVVRTVSVCPGKSIDKFMFVDEIVRMKSELANFNVIPGPKIHKNKTNACIKLIQINKVFNNMLLDVLPGSTIVDVASGPGSWSQHVSEFNGSKFNNTVNSSNMLSCSFKNNGNMTDTFNHPNRLRFEDQLPEFDLLNDSCVEGFISFVKRNSSKNGVELLMADGGIDGAYADQEARSLRLFSNEMRIAAAVLAKGGRSIIKLYIGETYETSQLVANYSQYFKYSFLIKPQNSNPVNGEVYLVSLNYLGVSSVSNYDSGFYKAGLENYINQFNYNRFNSLYNKLETLKRNELDEDFSDSDYESGDEMSVVFEETGALAERSDEIFRNFQNIEMAREVFAKERELCVEIIELQDSFSEEKDTLSVNTDESSIDDSVTIVACDENSQEESYSMEEFMQGSLEICRENVESSDDSCESEFLEAEGFDSLVEIEPCVESVRDVNKLKPECNIVNVSCKDLDYKFESVYILPNLKEIDTPPDGNCLFHSLALGSFEPDVLKQQLLEFYESNDIFNHTINIRDSIIDALTKKGVWAFSDIIDIYCKKYRCRVYEFDFQSRLVIIHGIEFEHNNITCKYILFRQSHYSVLLEKTSIFINKFIDEHIYRLTTILEKFPDDLVTNSVFADVKTINEGYHVIHVNSISVFPSKFIKTIKTYPDSIPFVLVSISNGSDEDSVSSADLHKSIIEHWRLCKNCKEGKMLNWFHHTVLTKLQFSCKPRKECIVSDDISFCDIIIKPYKTDWVVTTETLSHRIEGEKLLIAYPSANMSEELIAEMLKILFSNYDLALVNSLGLDCEMLFENYKFFNCLVKYFDVVYHKKLVYNDNQGYEFNYNVLLGNNMSSIVINSMNEIRAAYRSTLAKVLRNCVDIYNKFSISISNGLSTVLENSVNVLCISSRKLVVCNRDKKHAYGYGFSKLTQTGHLYSLNDYYSSNSTDRNAFFERMMQAQVDYIIMYRATEVLLEPALYDELKEYYIMEEFVKDLDIEVIRGVPGAGKTAYILNRHNVCEDLKEIVLTATREAANDIRSRVSKLKKFNDSRLLKYKYATLESAVMNSHRYVEPVETVYFDEAFLKHMGLCFWGAYLLKAKTCVFVGDESQVPYTDRNNLQLSFSHISSLAGSITKEKQTFLHISHRVPRDVCTMINKLITIDNKPMYSRNMETSNKIERSFDWQLITGINDPKMSMKKFDHYLVFTQDEKSEMNKKGYVCNTIHEFQGQQRDNIAIVRIRSVSNQLYSNSNHILTGISRHKVSFCYFTVTEDTLSRMITRLIGLPIQPSVNCGGGYVFNTAYNRTPTENRTNPRLTGTDLSPGHELVIIPSYTVDLNKEDRVLADIVQTNDGNGTRGAYIISREVSILTRTEIEPVLVGPTYDNINILQTYVDLLRPGSSLVYTRHYYDIFEHSDLNLTSTGFKIAPVKSLPEKNDTMTPTLRTSCPQKFQRTQKSFLKAFNERNGAIDVAETAVYDRMVLDVSFDTFCKTYFKPGYENLLKLFKESPITVNVDSITKWLATQPPSVYEDLKSVELKHLVFNITNKYSYMLKNMSKPKLDPHPENDFSSPQAIAFLSKLVNCIYCPVVQEIKKRIQILLKPDKLLFTDMSVSSFQEILTELIPKKLLKKIKTKFEIDFSKYDRSQRGRTLEFECQVLRAFGMPENLITLWVLVHKVSVLIATDVRFKAIVEYQRKSGDAMTFLGNTLWLMYVLLHVLGYETLCNSICLFGGDDSLILCLKNFLLTAIDLFKISSSSFNMELKVIDCNSFYFCSRFLVYSDYHNAWYVIPDPLKALIKLGRYDLVNSDHANEYRISLRDNWVNYGNVILHEIIDYNFNDRYQTKVSISLLLAALYNIVNDPLEFRNLYYWYPGDSESVYTKLPSLDI